jgi:tryptophan-rich sensory protein
MLQMEQPLEAPEARPEPAALSSAGNGERSKRWLGLAGFVLPVAATAALGSRFAPKGDIDVWYRSLRKPPFQPPNGAFAPIWTVLYGTIAVSGWRVWQAEETPERRRALALWGAQLAANASWTPVFFGARRPRAALAVLAAQLGLATAYTAAAAEVDRPAAAVMTPYLAWSGFACVLNQQIVTRNPELPG